MSEFYPRRCTPGAAAWKPGTSVAALLAVLGVPFSVQLAGTAAGPVPEAMWPVLVMSVWASFMTAGLLGLALATLVWRAWRSVRQGFSLPLSGRWHGGAGGRL